MSSPFTDRFATLRTGQSASMTKKVTDTDIVLFAVVSGDSNPVHVDQAHAEATQFRERIAHGMLTASFISATMAMKLPGPGAVYLSQTLRFIRPVRIGDTVTATVEVQELMPSSRQVRLSTVCRNQRQKIVLDGEALVLIPEES